MNRETGKKRESFLGHFQIKSTQMRKWYGILTDPEWWRTHKMQLKLVRSHIWHIESSLNLAVFFWKLCLIEPGSFKVKKYHGDVKFLTLLTKFEIAKYSVNPELCDKRWFGFETEYLLIVPFFLIQYQYQYLIFLQIKFDFDTDTAHWVIFEFGTNCFC